MAMRNFRRLIESETKKINRLHQRVDVTFKTREKDVTAWQQACMAFHSYACAFDPLIDRLYESLQLNDEELIEFAITFLELNPMFFRSGYIKEEMLKKLKRTALSEMQSERLQKVLLDAVNNRGTREFRRYCRLLPQVLSPGLIAELENAYQYGDGARKSRAAMMLNYANAEHA